MKTVLITGASSGIGYHICEKLIDEGMMVIGISRTPSSFSHKNFIHYEQNLMDISATEKLIREILKEHEPDIIINNAGSGYYGLHEELNPAKIHELVTTNLEVPFLITNLALRNLKKKSGAIINISSVTAGKSNPHGAAYGATKAGLSSFSCSIFDEARKAGVRVITIEPDMTDTNLYRNADFGPCMEDNCYLKPEDVAEAVSYALNSGFVTKMELKPQFHRITRRTK